MDFNRFESKMRNLTPEGQAMRAEQGMTFDELVSRFGGQANRDIEIGNAWAELSNDIVPNIDKILDDRTGFGIALEIGKRHRRYMEDKGLDGDDNGIAAYITAIAQELRRKKKEETH